MIELLPPFDFADGLKKYVGLMFKTRNTNPLYFEFNKEVNIPIHSIFVFFPFKIIWYNKNEIIEQRIIKPFQWNIKPSRSFDSFIEIPILKTKDI